MDDKTQTESVECYYCGANALVISIDGAGVSDPVCCEVSA